ncbi:DNA polymerase I [Schaalia naturae]
MAHVEHTDTDHPDTLLIIDGHSMAFRAFYALPADTFTTTTGQHTNAVYGFVTMLLKLLEMERPTRVAVAFDVSRHSFRTEEYPEYKGTRGETPPEFIGQVELIGEVLDAMGIRRLTRDGYEADDILATLATEAAARGWDVLVASGDRDSFQLISDRVTVLYPGQGPGDLREMTPEAVQEKYGLPPAQYPELAALVGETSDNLPGVPGVGPKTAAQWLAKFGGLENLLARADEVGGKRGQALRDNLEEVRRNRRLNHLLTDLDLGVDVEDLRRGPTDRRAVEDLFDVLEFTGLRRRVLSAADIGLVAEEAAGNGSSDAAGPQEGDGDAEAREDLSLTVVGPGTDVSEWTARVVGPAGLWIDGSRRPGSGDAERLALADGTRVLVAETSDLEPGQEAVVGEFLADCPGLVVHDGKGTWHALRGRGWTMHAPAFDVELAAYLIRPEQRGYAMETLVQRYLGRAPDPAAASDALFELGGPAPDEPEAPTSAQTAAARAAWACVELSTALAALLEEHEESHLMGEVELPLQGVLARMEDTGIAMDPGVLDTLRGELSSGVERAASEAYKAIGRQVNLSSPKQLQEVLFDQLKLPYTKKTKTGYTTNAEALQELWVRTQEPFLEHLLTHRDRIKLLQMVESLQAAISPDGRIHTTFSQVVAATGRLASSDPNLQNIPARTADGRRIRHAFVAGRGFESLLSADYSQIEMRIMAHLSRDAGLIEAFNSGEDLHRTMASMVFGTPVEEVSPDQRTRIKATSYGLAYGLSSYGLSQQLGIPVPEAAELRERYFERFGGVRDYLAGLVAQARRDGYTQTMFHRRRYLPDLSSENRQRREMAERAALNAPIQGSAADIIKIAMVRVDAALREAGLSSRLLLQIHDELIVEVAPGEVGDVTRIVSEGMASPVHMDVPLEVAIGVGRSWMEAAH